MFLSRLSNRVRRTVFPRLHPLDGHIGTNLIPPKGKQRNLVQERGDHCTLTVMCEFDTLVNALLDYGYAVNPLATLKYVEDDRGDKVWEEFSMAYRSPRRGKWMHHAFAFPVWDNRPGTFIIGHHKEVNYWYSPSGHTTGPREGGDPDGHLRSALDEAGIEYKEC